MAIQTAQLIRIAADETKFETPKDINTGEAVKWYKGNNLQFQVGVFNGDSIVASVTNLAELRLVVKALGSGGGAPPDTDAALMSLDQATIDGTVIQDTWDDGTKQHAVFDFTDAESNIAAGDVWLAIMAKTTDATAKWKTVAAGLVTVLEDAIPTSGQTISPQTGFVRTNSTIIGLIGGTATDFDSLVTVNGTIPTGAVYLITVGGIQYVYELTVGTDAESSPTVIRPDDYAASTNEVVWKLLEIQAFELALIQENTPADPTLSFGEDDGFYSEADDFISVATNGARRFFWNNDIYGANNANGPAMLNEAATNTNPPFAPDRSDDDTGYSIGPSVNELAAVCGGVEAMRWQANAVFIPEYLSHLNDGNTEMRLRDDQVTIYAGGVALIDAQETTQDILKLGDTAGGGDVDINFNNGQGLLRGSDGFWKIGGDGNIDQRLHIEGSTSVEAIRIETTAVNGNAQLILDNDAQQWIIETAGDNSDRLIIRDQTQGHDRFQFRTDGWIEFFGQTLDAYMLFDTNKVNGQCRIDWTNDAQTWSLYGVDSSDNFHIRDVTNAQDVLTITDGDGTVNANVGDIRVSGGQSCYKPRRTILFRRRCRW